MSAQLLPAKCPSMSLEQLQSRPNLDPTSAPRLSISLTAPTRAAISRRTSPVRRAGVVMDAGRRPLRTRDRRSVLGGEHSTASILRTSRGRSSPAEIAVAPATSARWSTDALVRSVTERRTLRLDTARPSSSRTVGQATTSTGRHRSRDEPAHDGNLLEILLAEVCAATACQREELGHHGGDAVEVAGAELAFEHVGEPVTCTVVPEVRGWSG